MLNIVFASIAGGKYRNKAFFVGIIISVIAMIAMAMGGANLWVIVGATAFMNLGSPLAGEALYKVWTQNPSRLRSVPPCRALSTASLVCAVACSH